MKHIDICAVEGCERTFTKLPRNRRYCDLHSRKRLAVKIKTKKNQKYFRVAFDPHPLSLEGYMYSKSTIKTMYDKGALLKGTLFVRNGLVYEYQNGDMVTVTNRHTSNLVTMFEEREAKNG